MYYFINFAKMRFKKILFKLLDLWSFFHILKLNTKSTNLFNASTANTFVNIIQDSKTFFNYQRQ